MIPLFLGNLGRYGSAGSDQGQGLGQAAEPGQALGAAGAGNQAQLYLRLPHQDARGRHAEMAGHGQFQSAAQGRPVDGGHHRLGAIFDAVVKFVKGEDLFAEGLDFGGILDFGDVGAGHEIFSGAGDDDGLDDRILGRGGKGCGHLFTQGRRQLIDRRAVQPENRHPVVHGDVDGLEVAWHCDSFPFACRNQRRVRRVLRPIQSGRSFLKIFPTADLGSSSTKTTDLGTL